MTTTTTKRERWAQVLAETMDCRLVLLGETRVESWGEETEVKIADDSNDSMETLKLVVQDEHVYLSNGWNRVGGLIDLRNQD